MRARMTTLFDGRPDLRPGRVGMGNPTPLADSMLLARCRPSQQRSRSPECRCGIPDIERVVSLGELAASARDASGEGRTSFSYSFSPGGCGRAMRLRDSDTIAASGPTVSCGFCTGRATIPGCGAPLVPNRTYHTLSEEHQESRTGDRSSNGQSVNSGGAPPCRDGPSLPIV